MKNNEMRFENSNGKSIVSRRWKIDVKETVNEYNFHLKNYHRQGGKCDFCGSNLIYVAEIYGESIVPTKYLVSDPHYTSEENYKTYDVGFDCLNLVFGDEWEDHRKADRVLKQMKNEATQERRKEKYAVEYTDIIKWLNQEHYQDFINANQFLVNMREILTTGSRVFTTLMQSGVRRFMERSYGVEEYARKLKNHKEVVLPKIKNIYDMVVRMDNIDPQSHNIPKWSAYKFVSSVYFQARDNNRISSAQLSALMKVNDRYLTRMSRNHNPEFQKLVDEVPY